MAQEKQKNYAKASLDRYFNSLEQVYPHNGYEQEVVSIPDRESIEELDEPQEHEEHGEQHMNHSNDEGHDMDGYHEQNNNNYDEYHEQNNDDFDEDHEDEHHGHHKHARHNEEIEEHHVEFYRHVRDEDETVVNTEVSAVSAATLQAGGITDRAEQLGIDLSFLRESNDVKTDESQNQGDNKKEKMVLLCPECGVLNKEYMTWCRDCGEMLLGVDPIPAKRGHKSRNKSSKHDKIDNIEKVTSDKNVTFVEKDNLEIPPKPEVSPAHSSPKLKSPNKSESRDSGRPSSEDMDISRTEKEVIEICESINDPVVKGFIKNYLGRKSKAIDHKKKGTPITATHNEEKELSEEETSEVNIEDRPPSRDTEISLDLKEENVPEVPEEAENEYVWLHEYNDQPHQPDKPLRGKKSGSLDIEIYTLEESRESRNSSRREYVVPMLNLANSSDEEEEIVRKPSDTAKIMSYSLGSTDSWQELFEPPPIAESPVPPVAEEPPPTPPILEQIIDNISDNVSNKTKVPKRTSKNKNATPTRSKSPSRSKMRKSLDSTEYARKWEKSSVAWSSYSPAELSTQPSVNSSTSVPRPRSANSSSRRRKLQTAASLDTINLQELNDNIAEEDLNNNSSHKVPSPSERKTRTRPTSADLSRRYVMFNQI